MEESEHDNFAVFRDCLSTTLLEKEKIKSEPKRRRRSKVSATNSHPHASSQHEAEELADFIDYLAHEIFENLPQELRDFGDVEPSIVNIGDTQNI
ncbi:hypothetical protein V2A60_004524 [Cordyceps javanica]